MITAKLLLIALCVLTINGETSHVIDKRGVGVFDVDDLIFLAKQNAGCFPNPCYNQGVCQPKLNSEFQCLCPEPYFGKMCLKVRNVCENVICFQGSCLVETNPPYSQCKCRHPFTGPNCLFSEASPCYPSPCLNGGICLVIPPTRRMQFACICQDGYTGEYCETTPDDCYVGNGETYRGVTQTTENMEECLYWNDYRIVSQVRDPFSGFAHNFQMDSSGKLVYNNHCRNQNGAERPWCYVMRGGQLVKAFCKVSKCLSDEVSLAIIRLLQFLSTVTPSPQTSFSQCGVENQSVRVIGGTKAIPGSHPWQASLQRKHTGVNEPFEHWCGGTLIESCWVVTAAHCLNQGFDYQVVLGGVNITGHEDMDQIIPVANIYSHEGFSHTSGTFHADIALLKLQVTDSPYCAKETPFVKAACLTDQAFPAGKQCVVSGWGATETADISDQLLRAKITLISKDVCNRPNILGNSVDETMLCAGVLQGGTDSCQGDSGGPVMCEKDGVKYLTGVVSWGVGCALRNKPGIYADVFYFKDWIKNKMTGN